MSYATEQMQEARWQGYGNNWPEGHRPCMKCKEMKPISNFHKHAKCKEGVNTVCKSCRQTISINGYLKQTTQYKLWYRAKRRAKEKGLDFTINIEDIYVPEVCPVFLVPFEENTPHSASLDRIDSSKGYIKGNVFVVSTRVNVLKNNITLQEMERLIAYMRK